MLADLTGSGKLMDLLTVEPVNSIAVQQLREFSAPGTYFVAARVTAQVDGDPSVPHARVQNIGRARVTVLPAS